MTVKLIGNDDISGISRLPANVHRMARFQAIQTGLLTEIRVEAGVTAHVKFAVYSDDGTSPNALITNTDEIDIVVGVNTVPITPISVVVGAYYWLTFIQAASSILYKSATGDCAYYTVNYAGFSFPNPMGTHSHQTVYQYQIAGWGTVSGRRSQVIIL
jgi:hypothetical protein